MTSAGGPVSCPLPGPLACASGVAGPVSGRGQAGTAAARARAAARWSFFDGMFWPAAARSALSSRAAAAWAILGLGGRVLTAAGQQLAGLVPGGLAERRGRGLQLGPRHGDPAALVMVADPDPGHVIRVVMHLPQALPRGDTGVLVTAGVQVRAVVLTVADLDAVGVDRPPGHRQKLDVTGGRRRDRHIAGGLGQRGVLLAGGQRPPRYQRVAQPVMRPVLPAATIHSSSRSCNSMIDHAAASSAFLPRRSTLEPT